MIYQVRLSYQRLNQMNKKRVVEILKRQEAEICRDCDETNKSKGRPIADIDLCFNCKIHKLVNSVMRELNGGD